MRRGAPTAFYDCERVTEYLLYERNRIINAIVVFNMMEGFRGEPEFTAILIGELN